MSNIRVRFPPSPTGIPHLGNTRTAFFNYLFAKHNNGKFVLRVEDTDQARLVPKSLEAIYEILHWLGLDPDEGPGKEGQFGPYVQSERKQLYIDHAQELAKKGLAYEDDGAIRFRIPKEGETSWVDLIGNKHITFQNKDLEDFVILKSDQFPTYHLASVIDDHLMEISHVIRGEEWISSTPKHLLLYQAFGFEPPLFVHLPVILGGDKGKLSKRHGAESILEYRDKGYLKEALLNFMALLGWAPGEDKEIMSMEEMIELFSLEKINTGSPVFDVNKLNWFNGQYIRKLTNQELLEKLTPFVPKEFDPEVVKKTLPLVKERLVTLADYLKLVRYFFEEPQTVKLNDHLKQILQKYLVTIEKVDWSKEELEKVSRDFLKENNLESKEVFSTLRDVLTGEKATPPLFEVMEVLGKEKTLSRIKHST